MRILVVLDDYFNKTNGMCISTQRFVHEFRKQGHNVRIISTGKQADYPLHELVVPFFKKIIAKEGFHLALPKQKAMKNAVKWADIVLIETPFPLSWQSARIAHKMNKAVIATFHIYPGNITEPLHINNKFWNNFFMYFFRDISFKNCDAIQCPTVKVKNVLQNYNFKPRLYVNSNGISTEFINNNHKDYVGHPFTILCVGRFSQEKHQEILLKAMKIVNNGKIKLILAGQGQLEKKYRKLASQIPNQLTMKLYKPSELRKVMAKSDLIVHCADVEIEGMACMEGFAVGCVPIIADSPLSSTVDYALGKYNQFPAGDPIALAQKIKYWYNNPSQLKKTSHQYRKYATKLSIHYSAQKYLQVMSSLINSKK